MQNKETRLTDKEYWLQSYGDHQFGKQDEKHDINIFIKKYIKKVKNGKCLELGSFPGPFLSTLGDLGYKLNGIDYHPDNATKLPNWLKSIGYHTENFMVEDIFNIKPSPQFDLVCSFGLIEHFTNYKEVIHIHSTFLKTGGTLLITTPNMKGWMQQIFRRILDKKNLDAHYLPSMNPKKWSKYLNDNGFRVEYYGYFGNFGFWVAEPQNQKGWKKHLLQFVFYLSVFFRRFIPFESSAYSCYCGIVAQKIK